VHLCLSNATTKQARYKQMMSHAKIGLWNSIKKRRGKKMPVHAFHFCCVLLSLSKHDSHFHRMMRQVQSIVTPPPMAHGHVDMQIIYILVLPEVYTVYIYIYAANIISQQQYKHIATTTNNFPLPTNIFL